MVAIAVFPKKTDYQVNMKLLKEQGKLLEKAQDVMYFQCYDIVKFNGFSMEAVNKYQQACIEKMVEADMTVIEAQNLFHQLSFVVNTEGYSPSWYIADDCILTEVVKISHLDPIVRHLDFYKNSGVVAELKELESEILMLKGAGTSKEALDKWKKRIAGIKRNAEYKERLSKIKLLESELEMWCKRFQIEVPNI